MFSIFWCSNWWKWIFLLLSACYSLNPEKNNSVLWNAMIHPLLNMTIKGAIWYQGKSAWRVARCLLLSMKRTSVSLVFTFSGEANVDYHQDKYSCSFPAMICDWRMAFHQGSGRQTAKDFPFGFVQVYLVLISRHCSKWFHLICFTGFRSGVKDTRSDSSFYSNSCFCAAVYQ